MNKPQFTYFLVSYPSVPKRKKETTHCIAKFQEMMELLSALNTMEIMCGNLWMVRTRIYWLIENLQNCATNTWLVKLNTQNRLRSDLFSRKYEIQLPGYSFLIDLGHSKFYILCNTMYGIPIIQFVSQKADEERYFGLRETRFL